MIHTSVGVRWGRVYEVGAWALQFSAKEMITEVEYEYCLNLTIMDSQWLTAPAPARKYKSLGVNHLEDLIFILPLFPSTGFWIDLWCCNLVRVNLLQWNFLFSLKCSRESSLSLALKTTGIGATHPREGWWWKYVNLTSLCHIWVAYLSFTFFQA